MPHDLHTPIWTCFHVIRDSAAVFWPVVLLHFIICIKSYSYHCSCDLLDRPLPVYYLLCWVELEHVGAAFPVTDLARGILSGKNWPLTQPCIICGACMGVGCRGSVHQNCIIQPVDEAEWSPICELLQIIICIVWGRSASHKMCTCAPAVEGRGGWGQKERKKTEKPFHTHEMLELSRGVWETYRTRLHREMLML